MKVMEWIRSPTKENGRRTAACAWEVGLNATQFLTNPLVNLLCGESRLRRITVVGKSRQKTHRKSMTGRFLPPFCILLLERG
jgi:hypothetical protein